MDKSKFTTNPHLDSEGFTMADARCHGCAPNEPCSRSGHCERYDSPLRQHAARITLGSDPFGRRYELDSHGRYIGLDRRS